MEAASSLRLWEISDELAEIAEALIEGGGELTPDLESRLDALEGAFEEKVERVALYVRELKVNAAAAGVEADRLAAIQNAFERKAEGLTAYLQGHLTRQGMTKVNTPRVRVRIQANSRPSIRYMGEWDKLPEAFIKRLAPAVNTEAAYQEWKAGAELPEGFVVDTGFHIRIQ